MKKSIFLFISLFAIFGVNKSFSGNLNTESVSTLTSVSEVSLATCRSGCNGPLKFDVMCGAIHSFDDMKGLVLSFEPKYRVSPSFFIGLRLEEAVMGDFVSDGNKEAKFLSVTSAMPTFEYKIGQNCFQPFIGLGVGAYANVSGIYRNHITEEGHKNQFDRYYRFGLSPRIGFELSRLRLSIEYNAIFGEERLLSRNYFAAKLGFSL